MKVSSRNGKVQIELEKYEPHWLVSMLLHAKFGDGPKSEIWGHPMIIGLIRGIWETKKSLGLPPDWEIEGVIPDELGSQPPSTFYVIESWLEASVAEDQFEQQFADAIYPWIMRGKLERDIFIEPGRRVRFQSITNEAQQERYGIVIKTWSCDESGFYKSYVAVQDDWDPLDKTGEMPPIECHRSADLRIVS